MVQLLLTIQPRPFLADALVKGFQSLVWPTQREEGCLQCRLFRKACDKDSVSFESYWRSRESLDGYLRSSTFLKALELMEKSAEPPLVEIRLESETHGLDYVAAVRTPVPQATFSQGEPVASRASHPSMHIKPKGA